MVGPVRNPNSSPEDKKPQLTSISANIAILTDRITQDSSDFYRKEDLIQSLAAWNIRLTKIIKKDYSKEASEDTIKLLTRIEKTLEPVFSKSPNVVASSRIKPTPSQRNANYPSQQPTTDAGKITTSSDLKSYVANASPLVQSVNEREETDEDEISTSTAPITDYNHEQQRLYSTVVDEPFSLSFSENSSTQTVTEAFHERTDLKSSVASASPLVQPERRQETDENDIKGQLQGALDSLGNLHFSLGKENSRKAVIVFKVNDALNDLSYNELEKGTREEVLKEAKAFLDQFSSEKEKPVAISTSNETTTLSSKQKNQVKSYYRQALTTLFEICKSTESLKSYKGKFKNWKNEFIETLEIKNSKIRTALHEELDHVVSGASLIEKKIVIDNKHHKMILARSDDTAAHYDAQALLLDFFEKAPVSGYNLFYIYDGKDNKISFALSKEPEIKNYTKAARGSTVYNNVKNSFQVEHKAFLEKAKIQTDEF